jgi:hypothetical protein
MNIVAKSSRQVKLESIWLDICFGVAALILSPWLARLLKLASLLLRASQKV